MSFLGWGFYAAPLGLGIVFLADYAINISPLTGLMF